jgi:hypothetical protein
MDLMAVAYPSTKRPAMRGRAVRHLAAAPSAERGVGAFYSNFSQTVPACRER